MAERKLGSLYVELVGRVDKFQAAMSKVQLTVQRTGKRISSLGKEISTGIGLPLAALAAAAVKATLVMDDAMDKIRTSTGKTGRELDDLQKSFTNVFKKVPDSADQVASAMSQISIKTGLTGKALEDLTVQMLDLARVTKSDVGSTITSTTKLFGAFNIATDKQSESLDMLMKASQLSGASVLELADAASAGAPAFKQLGIDLAGSLALVGQWKKAGLDAETGVTAMGIAVKKMSSAGIKDLPGAFKAMVDQIKATGDASKQNALSIQLFGKSGVMMAEAIRKGTFDTKAWLDQLRNSKGTIQGVVKDTEGLIENLGRIKNAVIAAAAPLESALNKVLVDNKDKIDKVVNAIERLSKWFESLPASTQGWIVSLTGATIVIGPLVKIVGALVSGISLLISPLKWAAQGVLFLARTAIPALVAVFAFLLTPIGAVALAIAAVGALAYTLYDKWEPLKQFFVDLWTKIEQAAVDAFNAMGPVFDAFVQSWEGFKTGVTNGAAAVAATFLTMRDMIVQYVTDTYNGIKTWLVDKWDDIVTGVKGGVDKVIGFFDNLYEEVIGHSSVPDTIEGIRTEMAKLNEVMVKPVGDATSKATGFFAQLAKGTKAGLAETARNAAEETKKIKAALDDVATTIGDLVAKTNPAFDQLRVKLTGMITSKDFDGIAQLAVSYSKTAAAAKIFKETLADAAQDAANAKRFEEGLNDELKRTNDEMIRAAGGIPTMSELGQQISDMMQAGNMDGIKALAQDFKNTEDGTNQFNKALQEAQQHMNDLKQAGQETASALVDGFNGIAEALGMDSKSAGVLSNFLASMVSGVSTGGPLGQIGAKLGGQGGILGSIMSLFGGGGSSAGVQGIGPVANGSSYAQMLGGGIGPVADGGTYAGMLGKTGTSYGSILQGAGAYAQGGSEVISSIISANKTNKTTHSEQGTGSALGAGAGGILGGIFGGPAGAAAGAQIGNIIGGFLGGLFKHGSQNPETKARHAFAGYIEDQFKKLGEVSFYDAKGVLQNMKGKDFNFLEGDRGRFNAGGDTGGTNWGDNYKKMGSDAMQVFNGLGAALKQLLNLTDADSQQIGYLLATNLSGNIDNARLLVRQLGISMDDMLQALTTSAEQGQISWMEYNSAVAGVNKAYEKGVEGVGAYGKALKQVIDSGGRGMAAVIGVQNVGIEAIEGKVKDLAELKQKMLAEGDDPAAVEALFKAAAQRGIKTLDDWKNMSDETAGAIAGDMGAIDKGLADKWQAMSATLDDINKKIASIPDKVEKSIDISVNMSDEDRAALDAASGGGASAPAAPATPTQKAAKGRILHVPTTVRMANGGMLKMAEVAAEAVLPLKRTRGGNLGVEVAGMGKQGLELHIHADNAQPGVSEEIVRVVKEMEGDLMTRTVDMMQDIARRGGI